MALDLPPVERSMEDVLAGLIRFTLGGRPFAMAVLPMGAHDRWEEALDRSMEASFDGVPDDWSGFFKGVAAAFKANREQMLDALIAYDRDGALPAHDPAFTDEGHRCPRDEIREIATQQDIIFAIKEVRAVGSDPLGTSVLSALTVLDTTMSPTNGSTPDSEPSNGSHPSTTGRRRTSAKR